LEILNASEAKREFGDLLLKAQSAPVRINKNGKPVAVVISATDYEQLEVLKEEYLRKCLKEGLEDEQNKSFMNGKELFDNLSLLKK
jgi:prevent-host-death family protein